jgi:outer membrane receptor protein involved in Fe transport
MQFNPERYDDKWYQAALTIEGKIADFDVTYAGAYMRRSVQGEFDYSDYAYFYDALAGYGRFFYDNDYVQVSPNQYIQSDDRFKKLSQELRFTSPADRPIRLVGGLFYQRQQHNIEQNYIVDGIADFIKVPGTESNIWLTDQIRVDRDYAVFGELSYDITPQFTVTGGGRLYRFKNSLVGFFGFNYANFDDFESDPGFSGNPIYNCELFGPPTVGGPCNNVDKTTKGSGFLHRLNGTYKVSDDTIVYATWSKGYRPGGINRRGTLPPYKADFITNYELGAKIGLGRGAHLNLAAYQLDWSDIQLSFLGQNGLTEIRNAGDARIRGLEADLLLRPTPGLTLSLGAAYNNAKLRNPFCRIANSENDCTINADLNGDGVISEDDGEFNAELAPSGTRLPLTAKMKINGRARYEWPMFGNGRAHVQGTWTYEGSRRRDLRIYENSIYGNMDAYSLFDASAGVERGDWSLDLYAKNLFDKRGEISKSIQCTESVCGDPDGVTDIGGKIYTTVTRPRTIGLKIGRKF